MAKEREISFHILQDIMKNQAYYHLSYQKYTEKENLSPKEKAFITQLTNGTIKNQLYLDFILNQYSKVPTEKMKPAILIILRLSLYQIIYMDKIPPAAVCNEGVLLAKKKKFSNLSGFVNGILRNILRMPWKEPEEVLPAFQAFCVRNSMPEWIMEYWTRAFGQSNAIKIAERFLEKGTFSLTVNTLQITSASLLEKFKDLGFIGNISALDPNSILLENPVGLFDSNLWKQGYFHIQDQSSALTVRLLDPKPGDIVLDMCAAPGGKTVYMAEKMKNEGHIYAHDIYPEKVNQINQLAKELSLTCIQGSVLDGEKEFSDYHHRFDKILLDAPCSGLGLMHKKPEIKYRRTPKEIEDLQRTQRNLLKNAYYYLKPGGTMIYSTCTLSPKENIENIQWFTQTFPMKNIPLEIKNLPSANTMDKGYVHLFPHLHGTNGFFISKLIKPIC